MACCIGVPQFQILYQKRNAIPGTLIVHATDVCSSHRNPAEITRGTQRAEPSHPGALEQPALRGIVDRHMPFGGGF